MKYIIYILIAANLFIGCVSSPDPFKDCKIRPYTSKELKFIKQLEEDSILNPVLFRFDYNYRPNYSALCENQKGVYGVSSYTTPISMYEDSLKLSAFLKKLVIQMYGELMNDSLKFYTPCVQIDFSSYGRSKKFPNGTSINVTVLKGDFESYFGKKIVSTKYGLQWKKIEKTNELKLCLTDSCSNMWW